VTAFMPISIQSVRDYMMLEPNNPTSASRYKDETIGSNMRAASANLEMATRRFWEDRPATTYTFTTQGRAALYIPGIRNPTGVSWQGGPLTIALPPSNDGSCWFLEDSYPGQMGHMYTGVQLRVFSNRNSSGPSWKSNPLWFDQGADSPYAPWNRGVGDSFNSLPNDLAITGDWGFADGTQPEPYFHTVKVLTAFYTLRPASLLADVAITPSGGVLNYAQMPAEVANAVMGFVSLYGLGEQAVAVG
jgi:hypothetical protein